MSSKPLVTGIMIFLNADEKFFHQAIESVFAQTYDNWELIFVDDGSTNGSTEVAQGYAEKYPGKVRYLEHDGHQNRGMSASRNLGIRNAQGEYIAFLDADDIWLPPKLERQMAILEAQPEAAMVYGPTQMWYSWTGNPEDMQRDRKRLLGVRSDTLVKPPKLLTLILRTKKGMETPTTCGVLIRREVIESIGGFEESFRSIYEDQAFFAKLCLKAPVFVESGCWDKYRQHSDSNCYVAQKTGQFNFSEPNPARLTFLNWLADYLSKQGFKNTEVWQALQKALWPYHHPTLYRLSKLLSELFLQLLLVRQIKGLLKLIVRRTLPIPTRRWLRTH